MPELETATPKGEPHVAYCFVCGVEFAEKALTNRWFRCDSCETVIQGKTKMEKTED
jgi:hypothetical protein